MSSTPDPPSIAAPAETPQQTHQRRLLEKYGETVLKHGFTGVPRLLDIYQAEIGITPTEYNVIAQLWSFWWDRYPFPSLGTLAARMGRGIRAIRVHISRLKQPQYDEEGQLTRPMLINVKERLSLARGQKSNLYDFSPLLDILKALVERDQADSVSSTPRNPFTAPPGILLPPPPESGFRGIEEDESEEDLKDEYGFESSKALPRQTQNEGERTNVQHPQQNPNGATQSSGNARYIEPSKSAQQNSKQARNHQQPSNHSKPGPGSAVPAEATDRPGSHRVVRPYLPMYVDGCIREFSREFHDLAHLKSNLTQTANLYADAHIDEYEFGDLLYAARAIAKEARGITKESQDEGKFMGTTPHINRMPYFFKVLRDQLAQRGLLKRGGSEASS